MYIYTCLHQLKYTRKTNFQHTCLLFLSLAVVFLLRQASTVNLSSRATTLSLSLWFLLSATNLTWYQSDIDLVDSCVLCVHMFFVDTVHQLCVSWSALFISSATELCPEAPTSALYPKAPASALCSSATVPRARFHYSFAVNSASTFCPEALTTILYSSTQTLFVDHGPLRKVPSFVRSSSLASFVRPSTPPFVRWPPFSHQKTLLVASFQGSSEWKLHLMVIRRCPFLAA